MFARGPDWNISYRSSALAQPHDPSRIQHAKPVCAFLSATTHHTKRRADLLRFFYHENEWTEGNICIPHGSVQYYDTSIVSGYGRRVRSQHIPQNQISPTKQLNLADQPVNWVHESELNLRVDYRAICSQSSRHQVRIAKSTPVRSIHEYAYKNICIVCACACVHLFINLFRIASQVTIEWRSWRSARNQQEAGHHHTSHCILQQCCRGVWLLSVCICSRVNGNKKNDESCNFNDKGRRCEFEWCILLSICASTMVWKSCTGSG